MLNAIFHSIRLINLRNKGKLGKTRYIAIISCHIVKNLTVCGVVFLMGFQIDKMFGDSVPDTLEDFALASQIFQSEGFKYMIEMFRANKGERSGIIWWNLLDGWPQFSDAIVDYNYVKKMAYFTVRRIQKSVMFMFPQKPLKASGYTLPLPVPPVLQAMSVPLPCGRR